MNVALASKMRRPDLARGGPFAVTAPEMPAEPYQVAGGQLSARIGPVGAGAGASVGLHEGRISAGMMALIVAGLVAFYIWTRSHQA